MTSFQLYCLLSLDSIINCFQGFGFIICIISMILFVVSKILYDSDEWDGSLKDFYIKYKTTIKIQICVFLFGLFLMFVTAFIPTSKQMAIIYLVPKLTNSEQVQKIGKDSLNVLEKLSKEYLEKTVKN